MELRRHRRGTGAALVRIACGTAAERLRNDCGTAAERLRNAGGSAARRSLPAAPHSNGGLQLPVSVHCATVLRASTSPLLQASSVGITWLWVIDGGGGGVAETGWPLSLFSRRSSRWAFGCLFALVPSWRLKN